MPEAFPSIIRVDLGRECSPGIWEYAIASHGLCGKSHQPLLDACRQLKRMGGVAPQFAGLFRKGRDTPDLSCLVEVGAALTVSEPKKGNAPSFTKYQPFNAAVRETGEAA